MTQSFAQLFEESLQAGTEPKLGDVVKGTVVAKKFKLVMKLM